MSLVLFSAPGRSVNGAVQMTTYYYHHLGEVGKFLSYFVANLSKTLHIKFLAKSVDMIKKFWCVVMPHSVVYYGQLVLFFYSKTCLYTVLTVSTTLSDSDEMFAHISLNLLKIHHLWNMAISGKRYLFRCQYIIRVTNWKKSTYLHERRNDALIKFFQKSLYSWQNPIGLQITASPFSNLGCCYDSVYILGTDYPKPVAPLLR